VRVRWARQRLDDVGRGSKDPVRELLAVAYATNELESAAVLYVTAARDRGASWAVIGDALGVTRQAARQRYAGALRRREAHRADWRVPLAKGTALVSVQDQRGVWDGYTVRVAPK
jgi:hypothetical protein